MADDVDYSQSRAANSIVYEFVNGVQTVVGNLAGDKPAGAGAQPAGPAAALAGLVSAPPVKGRPAGLSPAVLAGAIAGGAVLVVLLVVVARRR